MIADNRTPPPSLKEVAAQLGVTKETLTYRYPDLRGKIIARISERKTRESERQRHELRAALMENPLPSEEVISARTGITLKYLGRLHPDLYSQYRERSDEARRLAVLNRRAAFETEIRSATVELIGRGIHPSRKRVFSSIENPTLKSTRLLDRQIAATLFELNLASGALPPGGLGPQPGSLGSEPSAGRAVVEP